MAYATFPDRIGLGAQFGPSVQISRNAQFGGRSEINIDWPRPKIRGVFATSMMTREQYQVVIEFFWAQEGAFPFLIRDWSDYIGTAEPLGTGDGTDGTDGTAAWQIKKRYSNSVRQLDRTITHVRNDGTLKVYVAGVLKTLTTHYTVNYEAGVITFTSGNIPTTGQAITADFTFDILAEFVNDWLPVELRWEDGGQNPDVQILEVLDD